MQRASTYHVRHSRRTRSGPASCSAPRRPSVLDSAFPLGIVLLTPGSGRPSGSSSGPPHAARLDVQRADALDVRGAAGRDELRAARLDAHGADAFDVWEVLDVFIPQVGTSLVQHVSTIAVPQVWSPPCGASRRSSLWCRSAGSREASMQQVGTALLFFRELFF